MFKNYNFFKNIKILFDGSNLKSLILIFIGIIFMGFFEILGVFSIAPFMAVILDPDIVLNNRYFSYVYNIKDFGGKNDFVIFLGIAVVVFLLISNIFQAFINWRIIHFTNIQSHRISTKLLTGYLNKPYEFYLINNTSEMTKNILTEVSRAMQGVIFQSLVALSKIILVAFTFALLFWVDSMIATVSAFVLIFSYGIVHSIVKHKVSFLGESLTTANYKVYKATNEALSSVKYIKVRGVEKEFVNSFCVPSKKISSYSTMNQMMALIPRYILEVIVFGGMILIVMVSSTNNPEVIPIMSLYAMAGYRLMPAIQSIYTGIVSIRYNISAFNMMTSNLSEADATIDLKPKPLRLIFNNKIEMEDIEYMYLNAKTTTINKINLTVKHNTTVGIIGTTGSGKTTLVDILLGLLSPNSGHIKIDGIKLNNNNISAWQDSIGYVPQSINLIDGTIRNNVAFGVPNNSIDDNQVIRALKIANMYDFVSSLDDGCDTLIGEKGVRLSGGQQQRIGIAMALYNNPSVLILDEATSSLDSITENTIMDTIHNLSHKKTIVMIAHRLSTVKECDIIYMMDKGKIIASGTYQQMSDSNESFRAMLDATI